MGLLGDIWKHTGGAVIGKIGDVGNYITTGTTDPEARRQDYKAPYDVNADAFNINNVAGANAYNQNAQTLQGAATQRLNTAENQLSNGFQAPRVEGVNGVRVGPANASTLQSRSGLNLATGLLDTAGGDARNRQLNATNLAQAAAMGNGPSVATGMVQENAASAAANVARAAGLANRDYGLAATAANTGYADAAAGAGLAYGDALAQQQAASRLAGTQAARQIQQSAEESLRMQAAQTAGARGANIGAALLNSQNNAAFQMSGANRQAGQVLSDQQLAAQEQAAAAQRAAALNAAATQRQFAAGQQMQDLQTAQTQASGQIGAREQQALGDARAAQIASAEQIAARGQLLDSITQVRNQDLGMVGAATGLANTGLGIDQLNTGVNVGNVDRSLQQQQINNANNLNVQQTNAQLQAQNNALTADTLNNQANRAAQQQAMAFAAQGDFTQLAAQMGMSAEQLKAQAYASAQQAGLDWEKMGSESRQNLLGGAVGAAGTVIGAWLSDKRAKNVGKKAPIPDFSKIEHRHYTYKDEHRDKPGAGRGKFTGGMVDQMPNSLRVKGDDGLERVDARRAITDLMSAVGDLQRKQKETRV